MLAVADSGQRGFFDASWCGNVVPRDSFYGLLAEHGERIVSDADFAECYSRSVTRRGAGGPRFRRAGWRRSCCSPIAAAFPTGRRPSWG